MEVDVMAAPPGCSYVSATFPHRVKYSSYLFKLLTIVSSLPGTPEGTGQAPPSEETMKISTTEKTGIKMSKVQTALLMFALCVCNLSYSVSALFTDQPVLYFPCGPRCHHCDNSASYHLGPLPLIFGLRLGRCSVHACRWGVNTDLGQG